MLKVQDIYKSYQSIAVLKGLNFEVQQGEVISIVGPSGAGKTTLLQILGTLDYPDSGEVLYDGISPFTFKDTKLSAFRNKNIGFVFQFHQLLPEFTAFENVCLPGYIGGFHKKEVEQKAKALIHLLGVEKRAEHKPMQLSGGEQQRFAVARALINSPKIVLADEPTGNLDSKNAHELHSLFFKLREELNQTFIIVTHNPTLADMTDRSLTMKDGVMV